MEVVINTYWPRQCVTLRCHHSRQQKCTEHIWVGEMPENASKVWYYYGMVRAQQTVLPSFDRLYFCELIPAFNDVVTAEIVTAVLFCDEHTKNPIAKLVTDRKEIRNALDYRMYRALVLTAEQYIVLMQKMRKTGAWKSKYERKCQPWAVKPTREPKIEASGHLNELENVENLVVIPFRPQETPAIAVLCPKTGNGASVFIQLDKFGENREPTVENDRVVYECRNRNQAALLTAHLIIEENYRLVKFSTKTETKLRHALPTPAPEIGDEAKNVRQFALCVNRLQKTLSYKNHNDDARGEQGLLVNVRNGLQHEAEVLFYAVVSEEYTQKFPVDGYLEILKQATMPGNSVGFLKLL